MFLFRCCSFWRALGD